MSLLLMLLYLFDKLNFEVVHVFLKDNKDKNKEKYFQWTFTFITLFIVCITFSSNAFKFEQ